MAKANATADPQEKLLQELGQNFGFVKKGQSVWEGIYSVASQKVASSYSPNVEEFARNMAPPKHADKAAKYAGIAWRTAVPLGYTFYKSSKHMRETVGSYFNLKNEYRRSLTASGANGSWIFSDSSKRPEVVVNEARLLGEKAKNDSKSMMVSVLLNIPNVLATHLQSVIDALDPYTGKKRRKPKTEWEKMQAAEYKDTADKMHGKIDDWLDGVAVNPGEGEDRRYNGMLNGIFKTLNNNRGLESLNDPKHRFDVLERFKEKALGPIITAGASLLTPTLTKVFNVRSDTAFKKPTAGKMIKALEAHLRKNPSPVSLSLPGCSKKDCSLAEYIVDIFEQHQADCGREEIPRRLKSQMSRAAEQIAEAIADPQRQLHAEALVMLVDKRYGIMSFSKGEANNILHSQELDEHLAKTLQKPVMSRRKKIPAPKVYERYQSTREQFAASWNNLAEEEKFLWSCFVPNEILSDIGVSKEELQKLRHQDNELWHETMEEFLKEMSKLNSKELGGIGLDDAQISLMREAISHSSKRNSHYLEKNRHEMTALVADAATLMDNKKPDFLKDILSRAQKRRTHRDILEEKNQEKSLAEQVRASKSETTEASR